MTLEERIKKAKDEVYSVAECLGFSDLLKMFRNKCGLDIEFVSESTGIKVAALQYLENGKFKKKPPKKYLDPLSLFYGYDLNKKCDDLKIPKVSKNLKYRSIVDERQTNHMSKML